MTVKAGGGMTLEIIFRVMEMISIVIGIISTTIPEVSTVVRMISTTVPGVLTIIGMIPTVTKIIPVVTKNPLGVKNKNAAFVHTAGGSETAIPLTTAPAVAGFWLASREVLFHGQRGSLFSVSSRQG